MINVIKEEDGFKVEKDGEYDFDLLPKLSIIWGVKVIEARIQMVGSTASIYGFTHMPIAYLQEGEGTTNYISPRTRYTTVSITAREPDQKYIEQTDRQVGLANVSKWSHDLGAQLSLGLTTECFQELYELIKTRQLTSLSFDLIFEDKESPLYQKHKERKVGDAHVLEPSIPTTYAVNINSAEGTIEDMHFATEPLELHQEKWGEYNAVPGGFDSDEDTFEAYVNRKTQKLSIWLSFSTFERIVILMLGLIAFGLLVIRWTI